MPSIVTRSPVRGAVACSMVRTEPSSIRTVTSCEVVRFWCFSISLPATPPPTAPSTVIAVRPLPLPIWLPTAAPSTPPASAPTPLDWPLCVTVRTDSTTPQSRHTGACAVFAAAGAAASLFAGLAGVLVSGAAASCAGTGWVDGAGIPLRISMPAPAASEAAPSTPAINQTVRDGGLPTGTAPGEVSTLIFVLLKGPGRAGHAPPPQRQRRFDPGGTPRCQRRSNQA